MLDREEYIEQAHFFTALADRNALGISTQDLLGAVREELLSTTKLPMAIDFLAGELRLNGAFAPGMTKLGHYFTPFQTFVIAEAESDRGRFDMLTALRILAAEALYRAENATVQGIFLFELESISRNRLHYDRGLEAFARDDIFDQSWKDWIAIVRVQIGLVDLADLIYVRSEHYLQRQRAAGLEDAPDAARPALFGAGEGRIALANRGKDLLLLFNALHRHLGYPEVPRPPKPDESPQLTAQLLRRVERIERGSSWPRRS